MVPFVVAPVFWEKRPSVITVKFYNFFFINEASRIIYSSEKPPIEKSPKIRPSLKVPCFEVFLFLTIYSRSQIRFAYKAHDKNFKSKFNFIYVIKFSSPTRIATHSPTSWSSTATSRKPTVTSTAVSSSSTSSRAQSALPITIREVEATRRNRKSWAVGTRSTGRSRAATSSTSTTESLYRGCSSSLCASRPVHHKWVAHTARWWLTVTHRARFCFLYRTTCCCRRCRTYGHWSPLEKSHRFTTFTCSRWSSRAFCRLRHVRSRSPSSRVRRRWNF